MKILDLLENTGNLDYSYLYEMTATEFGVVMNAIRKAARPFRLKPIATKHLTRERILDGGSRSDIKAVDFLRTVLASFKHPKHVANLEANMHAKRMYEANLYDLTTHLNIIVKFAFDNQSDNSSTPYNMIFITAKYDDSYMHDDYKGTVKIRVRT